MSHAEKQITEIEEHKGQSFDPCSIITMSIANIIIKIITGIVFDHDDPEFRGLIDSATRLFELIGPGGLLLCIPILTSVPSPAKTELIKVMKEVVDYVEKDIERHKKEFDPKAPPRDFIECYLKAMAEEV